MNRATLSGGGVGVLSACLLLCPAAGRAAEPPAAWPSGGHDLSNTRHQPAETRLRAGNARRLKSKWVFTTGGDVSATPAVVDGAVYVPDWAGNLFKVDAATGSALWARRITDYIGIPGAFSRATPAIAGEVVYLGTHDGAYMLAINAATGDLRWKTQLDTHVAARITQSAVVHNQRVYVGVASDEELFPLLKPGYRCCTFRGSVQALDAATGAVLWRTDTTLDNGGLPGGHSGAAVWGSTPVVDAARGSLYVTTGNNYSVPPGTVGVASDNHVDAVLALDLQTGAVKWSQKMQGPDAWNTACAAFRPRICPNPEGPDFDFGQGPMLFTASTAAGPRQLLGAGQKSGVFWAFDPATGVIAWSTPVGPGGTRGGLQWGSATDGNRIYVAVANSLREPFTLTPSGETTTGGAWSALDAGTGAILWQTAVPRKGLPMGAVSVANGVAFGGSMARRRDNMFAIDAATGDLLWSFPSGGSVNSGPAIVDGVVYWGSGYSKLGQGKGNNKLYAFAIP